MRTSDNMCPLNCDVTHNDLTETLVWYTVTFFCRHPWSTILLCYFSERLKTRRTISGLRWRTYCVPCGPAMALLPPSYCLPWTSCDSASLRPPGSVPASDFLWFEPTIRIHSRPKRTQQVQTIFCYLTRQVHTGCPFLDLIHPSWFLPLMLFQDKYWHW